MRKLLLATGTEQIDKIIAEKIAPELEYQVIGRINYKKDLFNISERNKPDLIIISKNLTGRDIPILECMLNIKHEFPDIRIIYLAGEIDEKNKEKMNELATLVMSGIYDILNGKKITREYLKNLILHPKTREDVSYLLKYVESNVIYENEVVEIEEEEEEVEDIQENGFKNVYVVSSIKPGSGKSFISTNLAAAIANFGVKKADGTPPKVAIIEADLQNLSIGTILQIEDNEKNLKTVMQKISTIIDEDRELIDDEVKIKLVNQFIKSSFKQYSNIKNLYALVGSQLTMDEVENIRPEYYEYLITVISEEYDVIIIDTNSSLAHITTYPLLRMCNTAFYVIDLDFNNIRNNSKYKGILKELDVIDKVKYVLNQDIDEINRAITGREMVEELEFGVNAIQDAGFEIIARIPEIPKEIFLNRLFEGTPIVLDETNFTLKARIELSKIANLIWDIENIDWLEEEYDKFKEKALKKKKFFR